jgi:sugar/nucleoside kinase (ribokinase family)
MEWDVAGVGNALMDALVVLDDAELIARLGLRRGTMHLVDHERWMSAYHEVQARGVSFESGGSCANTIATVGRLGGRALYCGQVGEDQMGHQYASLMEAACGGHRIRATASAPTGKCLSIISDRDAERTMLTDLGAATTLVDLGAFTDDLRHCRIAHFEGYTLLDEPLRAVVVDAMALASASGAMVSLDASDPFVVGALSGVLPTIIRDHVDVLFLNREEARGLSGLDDPLKGAQAVADRTGARIVAVKVGAEGSIVLADGLVHVVGAFPVQAVDTTGAGDAYAGGFLYGLIRGWPPARAGRLGSAVAALAVGQVGAVVKDQEALANALRQAEARVGTTPAGAVLRS